MMTEGMFHLWLTTIFDKNLPSDCSPDNPVLLIYDGHASHIGYQSVEWAMDRGVLIVTLPPHTSHRTQPLDLAVFGPLKQAYRKIFG
jgi:hypothetical protein